MEAKLIDFETSRRPAPAAVSLAHVLVAESGSALWVGDPRSNRGYKVAGHLSDVPALIEGDSVLISLSAEGAVVIGRLRRPGEAVAVSIGEADGAVRIDGGRSLTLKAGLSQIELAADGTIRVDGREIHSFAEGRLCLQGATIELN